MDEQKLQAFLGQAVGDLGAAMSGLMVYPMASKAREVGLALGAQAAEARWSDMFAEGGFLRFRRATETPFNLVLEARP
jgi:hypothetical protein